MEITAADRAQMDAQLADWSEALRVHARRPQSVRSWPLTPARKTLWFLAASLLVLAGAAPALVSAVLDDAGRNAVAYMSRPTLILDPLGAPSSIYLLSTDTPDIWGATVLITPRSIDTRRPGPRTHFTRYSTGPNRRDERGTGDDIRIPWGPEAIPPWQLANARPWCCLWACLLMWIAHALPLNGASKGTLRIELLRACALASLPTTLALGVVLWAWADLRAGLDLPGPFASGLVSACVAIVTAAVLTAFVLRTLSAPSVAPTS